MNPQVYSPLSFLPLSSLVLTVRSMLMFHCCQSKTLIMTMSSIHLHSSSICLCFVVYGFPTLTLFCSYLCFACVCFPPHSWTLWPLPACQIELGTVGKVTPVLQNTPPGGWWPHWHTHRPEEKKMFSSVHALSVHLILQLCLRTQPEIGCEVCYDIKGKPFWFSCEFQVEEVGVGVDPIWGLGTLISFLSDVLFEFPLYCGGTHLLRDFTL